MAGGNGVPLREALPFPEPPPLSPGGNAHSSGESADFTTERMKQMG